MITVQAEARTADTATLTPIQSYDFFERYGIPKIEGQTSLQDYQQSRCDIINSEKTAPVNGVDCGICGNKGVVYYVRDTEIAARSCDCMKVRQANAYLVKCGFSGDMLTQTFDNFVISEEWQERAKKTAVRFTETDGKEWLYFSGQNGSGKTHLCTAACKAFIEKGMTVQYVLWNELKQRIEANRFNEDGYKAIFKEIRSADVLYIDDFLKTDHAAGQPPAPPTKDDMKAAYPVINARYISGKKTIISSEHFKSEINNYDSAVCGRISERSAGFVVQIDRKAERDYRFSRKSG